ncbi:phosphoadenosine phosphosulfate reductase [Tsuneonella deserti]|uniref:Adenosine 5'-phosphosulfate reductase n=1 Tax=Tsuneonella deserti TaxID=2035528 RepID=A0ABQ1SAY1_9SPHN|nr:phosphoadenylyl-sulfate reductase [Tsuneonella deserti]GGD98219.1 phosphoadenosine phosphosulfate reductase [Tsuneonella deserti]
MADLGIGRLVDRIDSAPRFAAADAIRLNQAYRASDTRAVLDAVLHEGVAGRVAVVSSFGAESAVLLHQVAQVASHTPVLFLDTGKHFPETLAYRDELVAHLGLTNLQVLAPDPALLDARDGNGLRWSFDPDGCCEIRKVLPLAAALAGFDATLTGRKAFQASTRANLPRFELDHSDALGRLKINPLIDWQADDLATYVAAHGLPPHPLVEAGYPSIGCSPCTSKVAPGEDPRSGRWKGWDKTECGIHSPVKLGPDGELPPGYEPFL